MAVPAAPGFRAKHDATRATTLSSTHMEASTARPQAYFEAPRKTLSER